MIIQTILVAASVIAMLEGIFAFAGIGEGEWLRPDPICGAAGIPNKCVTNRKGEGFGRFYYNSFGMQDKERTLQKPTNTIRLACVGDSCVESQQVDRSQNFCNLLERRLSENDKQHNYEVLNFGVSMSNLAQIYLRIKHKILAFEPDFIVVAVSTDSSQKLAPNPEGGFLFARPNFFRDEKGNLIQDNTVMNQWAHSAEAKRMRTTAWLREHSRIWGVISSGVEQFAVWLDSVKKGQAHWGAQVTTKQTAFAAATNNTQQAAGNQNAAAQSKLTQFDAYIPATKFFWPTADALIREMNNECNKHNCQLVLVRLAGSKNNRDELERTLLEKTAGNYHIPLIDISPRLEPYTTEQLFYGNGARCHFTPLGHELMTDELYKCIAQLNNK